MSEKLTSVGQLRQASLEARGLIGEVASAAAEDLENIEQRLSQVEDTPGPAGADGKSAYQYAVDGGYTGTEAEFQALLADAASKQYVDGLVGGIEALLRAV